MKNVTTSRFGFTLIELLVVVLIIGILAVRLSGPYRGGMFVMYFDGVVGGQQRRLMCGELRTGDFNFQKNSGDFCNRVWQGKLLLEGNNTRLYSLNV